MNPDHQQAAERLAMEAVKAMGSSAPHSESAIILHHTRLPQLLADSARCKELESHLVYISETLCGVKPEEYGHDLSMVAAFVEGQIDKQSDRADKAEQRCKELEAEVARLRELVPPPRGPAHPTRCLCGFEGKTIKDIRAHRQQCEIWQSQFGWNSGTNP